MGGGASRASDAPVDKGSGAGGRSSAPPRRRHISFDPTAARNPALSRPQEHDGTWQCTQRRPETQSSKASRPRTVLRPCTEDSQATTRPNTEYRPRTKEFASASESEVLVLAALAPAEQVLAVNFGMERTPPASENASEPPASHRSAKSDISGNCIERFPVVHDETAVLSDGYGKASAMKANFGVTPTAGSTRGVMFAPDLQGEELRMLNQAPGDSVNTLSHGQVDDVAGLPSHDTHFADTIPSKPSTQALSRPSTQLSLATTRSADSSNTKLNLFAPEEEVDEIQLFRLKKAEKAKRDAENLEAIRARVKDLASHVLPPADPEELIFQMNWGFPPRSSSPGRLRPPSPPPAGWDDAVRSNRKFRLAIRLTLSRWISRCLCDNFKRMQWAVADKVYYKEKERAVCQILNRWFRDVLIPVFAEWKALAAQITNMRKKTRKVMMWMMKKDIIRAWGAWVACWAHGKDWRVCALNNCLHTRIKKANRTEILLFAKSKRGMALLHDFASLTVWALIEQIAAAKVDVESIHQHLTLEELMRQGVFRIDQKDKALKLVWKIDRLLQPDTARLDHLDIWDGKMLLGIDIYMDAEEELQAAKDREAADQRDDNVKEITAMNVDLSPSGKQTFQMNMANERLMETWAWGYIVELVEGSKGSEPPKLQSVRAKLVCQEYALCMVHVVDVIRQQELWLSQMKNGMGADEQWYDFEFGQYDEEGNYKQVFVAWEPNLAVVVSISDRGFKDDANPCKFVYHLDHRPVRQINKDVIVRPGSFNGNWDFTPGSRSVEVQLLLRVDEDFGTEDEEGTEQEPTPTTYEQGVTRVQMAHRKCEDYLKRMQRGAHVDSDEAEEARIELRRVCLSACDQHFEENLGYIHTKKLMLEHPMHTTCAYHWKMEEYWILDSKQDLNFLICSLDGKMKRTVELTSQDNLKIFAFCFDLDGNLYIANNQNTFYKFIPPNREKCDVYLRMWKADLFDPTPPNRGWQNASGVTCHDEYVFGAFRFGPILQMTRTSGAVKRVITLGFLTSNVEQICFAMHRFIIVDAHTIKVCDLDGKPIWVPLGPEGNSNGEEHADDNPNAESLGVMPTEAGGKEVKWRSYIEKGWDRPRVIWDGSFLWLSETQLRKTDDKHLVMRTYIWHCLAPMTWAAHLPISAEATRQYGVRKYIDITPYWDAEGKLHSTIRDNSQDLTPGTTAVVSASQPPTPGFKLKDDGVSNQISRQNSGTMGLAPREHDASHFSRPGTQEKGCLDGTASTMESEEDKGASVAQLTISSGMKIAL